MKSVKHILATASLLFIISQNLIAVDFYQWKQVLTEQIGLMGHRNWIVVADSAYPLQNSPGIQTILSNCTHEETIEWVRQFIDKQTHVKPVIYLDKEIDFLDSEELKNLREFRRFLDAGFETKSPQKMIHEDLIRKLDEASDLFNVIVIKTTCKIPYTSVFFELNCKYWNEKSESRLRTHFQK